MHAPVAEHGDHPVGRAGAVGGDHDPVAVGEQPAELGDEGGALPHHRVPAGRRPTEATSGPSGTLVRLHAGASVRTRSRSNSTCRRGRSAVSAPSGSASQVRASTEARSASSARRSAARSRMRRGSTSTTRASACSRSGSTTGVSSPSSTSHGSQLSMPSKVWPSASRSHCSRPHGCGADERAGPVAHLGGGQQLAAREDLDLGAVDGGALVDDRELGEPVDLVAPEVDAHRHVGGAREHVDDRAPHGHLAPVLDLVLAAVPVGDEPVEQLVGVDAVAHPDHERLHLGDVGAEALDEGPHRGHHHAGRPLRVAEAPQCAQPAAHGLHRRADPLERQRLPGGEQVDLVGAEERAEVADQPLRLARRRHGDEQRAAGRCGRPGRPGRWPAPVRGRPARPGAVRARR